MLKDVKVTNREQRGLEPRILIHQFLQASLLLPQVTGQRYTFTLWCWYLKKSAKYNFSFPINFVPDSVETLLQGKWLNLLGLMATAWG